MDITEIQDELLRLEYPNLLPDHDPDIERYYYLRSLGQSRDAMDIYQNRLRVRYPNDEFRTWLLRSYRSHDPAFRGLLAKGYRLLGARSLERVKQVLLVIAERAEGYNEKDVYSTIKTAEDILPFLPQERYEAVAGMERFLRYATALELKVKSIAKATELVRAYLTDTLSVVEEERRRRTDAQRRMQDEELQRQVQADWDSYYYQKKYGVHIPLLDLSTVVFSANDLARIEIPLFRRIEDQILGYCIKYWNAIEDPAFERILFLYSRKYGKKNYDVYMSIRRGRQAKHRDDEILASIMSTLVTGYYYSIQGDLYLQRNWNAIKHALANQNQLKALPAPEAKQIEDKSATKRAVVKRRSEKKPSKEKAPVAKIVPKPKSKTAPKIAPKSFKLKSRPAAVVAKPKNFGAQPAFKNAVVPAPKPVKVPYKLKPAPEIKTTIVAPVKPQPRPAPKPVRPAAAPKPVAPKPVARPAVVRPAPKPAVPAPSPKPLVRPAVKPISQSWPLSKPVVPVRPVSPPVVPTRPTAPPPKPAVPVRPVASAPPPKPAASPVKPMASAPPVQPTGYRPAPFVTASAPPKPKPKQRVFTNKTLEKAKGSVSDRLKKLSGRSYDVYEDRFLAKVRNAIRKVLGTGRGLFFNLPEEAEDLVYNFLRDHYSDPYMDWEDSADRKNLATMGFDLPSLHPVIDECYRTL
jgi:hypothetical protein